MSRDNRFALLLLLVLIVGTVGVVSLGRAATAGTDPRTCNCPQGSLHEAPGGGYMDERVLDRHTVVFMLKPHSTPGLLWLTAQVQSMSGLPERDADLAVHLSGSGSNRTLRLRQVSWGVYGAPVALTAAPYLAQVQINHGGMAQVVGFRFILVHVEGPVVTPGSLADPRDKCCAR
jgi:hypothetical protein